MRHPPNEGRHRLAKRERLGETAVLDPSLDLEETVAEAAEAAASRLGLPISLVTVVLDEA